ncbi:MAG: copper resistance protein NlpE [Rikenellaceae bacterium]|nr:copper resistance protein NlpE [Rikenellaceae bacterium]
MNRTILAIVVGFLAISCGQNPKKIADTNAAVSTDHTSRKDAAEYTGTYIGTVPCADCDGIEVNLRIKTDGEYKLKTRHIAGKEGVDDIHSEYDGKYIWDGAGRTLTLENISARPNKYLYSDGTLIQLDINGNRIKGPLADRYILKKQP